MSCSVGCKFGYDAATVADGTFGLARAGTARIRRSMESSIYYPENIIAVARRWVSTSIKQ